MQSYDLQIAPGGIKPVAHASQFDAGREITLRLYDGSAAYTPPTGTTIRIDGVKPDGNGFSYTDNITQDGNAITITTTQQMTIVEGTVRCEIRLSKGAVDIGTVNFDLIVEKSPIGEDTPFSETEIPAIIALAQEQVEEAAESAEDAEAWAVGERGGVPVEPTDPTYENNAKWWSEHSASIGMLTDTQYADLQTLFT